MKYKVGAVIRIKKSIPMWENDVPVRKGEEAIIVQVISPVVTLVIRAWFPSRKGSDRSESTMLREKEFELV